MRRTTPFRHFDSATVSLPIHVEFLNNERGKEEDMMPPLVLLITFVLLLIMFQVRFSFNLLVANCFRQNFGRQIFFPLAMATKMVAAWSAAWESRLTLPGVFTREKVTESTSQGNPITQIGYLPTYPSSPSYFVNTRKKNQ